MSRDYKELKIWKRGDELAKKIYTVTGIFPSHEQYGLTSQLRRAVLAVPTNIVEGFYRSKKHFANFLSISLSSLKETEYLINFAYEQGYLNSPDFKEIVSDINEVSRMLASFQKQLRKRIDD